MLRKKITCLRDYFWLFFDQRRNITAQNSPLWNVNRRFYITGYWKDWLILVPRKGKEFGLCLAQINSCSEASNCDRIWILKLIYYSRAHILSINLSPYTFSSPYIIDQSNIRLHYEPIYSRSNHHPRRDKCLLKEERLRSSPYDFLSSRICVIHN